MEAYFEIDPETGSGRIYLAENEDLYTAPDTKSLALELLEREDIRSIIFDHSRSTYIDSSTQGVFIKTLRKAKDLGKEVYLSNIPQELTKLYEITGLYYVFGVVDDDGNPIENFWQPPST